MVNLSLFVDSFNLSDNANSKQVNLTIPDAVNDLKNFQVRPSFTDYTGNGLFVRRHFKIFIEYEPGGSQLPVNINAIRVTATQLNEQTPIGTFANRKVTLVGMQAVPITFKNDEVEYILFFLSMGVNESPTFPTYNIYSQRVPAPVGESENITVLDTGADNVIYTGSSQANSLGVEMAMDVFNATIT